MRRWLARLAVLLAGLLLIGAGGVWYLAASLDLVALEARLALAVRERTGHDLRLEGLELRLLPLPALGVRGVELSAAPGFGPEPMLRVGRARARLRLLPLLRGELALGSLRLDGLELRLERSQSGRGSWETLVEHLGGQEDPASDRALPPIDRLVVRDAAVVLEDGSSGRDLGLGVALLDLAPLSGPGPSQLRMLAVLTSTQPAVAVDLTLHGRGGFAEERLVVSQLDVEATLRGEAVPGGEQALRLAAPFGFDPAAGSLVIDELELVAAQLRLGGSVELRTGGERPVLHGRAEAHSSDPRGLLRTLGRAAELADPAALSSASLRTAWRWDGEVLRLDDLEARVDDARVTGAITVSSFDPPALWFDLDADTLDLDRYATVGDGTAPGAAPSALRTAWLGGRLRVARVRSGGLEIEELELPFTLQGGAIALDGASARLLGGSVRGDLSAQLGDEPPRYRIRAQAMDLDLARMIEASGSGREVSGRLDLDLDLLTAGRDRTAMVASLDGRACVTARAGEMPLVRREGGAGVREGEGGWRARLAQERFARVRERLVAHASEKLDAEHPERLVFTRMGACFTLDRGVARSDDLRVDAERLTLEGAGELDLPAETMDISCSLTLGGLPPMALRIHGQADDPQVALDTPDALDIARYRVDQRRDALQAQADEQRALLQAARQDLRDDLRERSGEGVDRLLDHREQVLERRDELGQRVRGAGQELRGQVRDARRALREVRRDDDPVNDEQTPEEEKSGATTQGERLLPAGS